MININTNEAQYIFSGLERLKDATNDKRINRFIHRAANIAHALKLEHHMLDEMNTIWKEEQKTQFQKDIEMFRNAFQFPKSHNK